MKVTVLLFAKAQQIVGADSIELELEDSPRVQSVLDVLEDQYPAMSDFLGLCVVAINHQYAPSRRRIEEGDEVAIIPPVSGG